MSRRIGIGIGGYDVVVKHSTQVSCCVCAISEGCSTVAASTLLPFTILSAPLLCMSRYGHLSDGLLHLVLIRQCSRLQYLKFLLRMSHIGLEAGGNHGEYIQVVPAKAVRIEAVRCGRAVAREHKGVS